MEEFAYSLLDFMDKGGTVLFIIVGAAFLLWFLVFERLIYIKFRSTADGHQLQLLWRKNYRSVYAKHIRDSLLSDFEDKMTKHISLIHTLIRVTPVLGLFGTVYGMIEIFDVIAQQGTGDARAMADGISMATLPTMTGMAVAIIGLFFLKNIESAVQAKLNRFSEGLKEYETP